MYVIVEENKNCGPEERVFNTLGTARSLIAIQTRRPEGTETWCDITGVDETGQFVPASAIQVEDSGAGVAWLILGGMWGLRLRPMTSKNSWSLDDSQQWGVPFLVLDSSGTDIRFS